VISQPTSNRPALPTGAQEVFMPASLGLEAAAEAARRTFSSGAKRIGMLYRPALLAQAQVRYLKRTYTLDYEQSVSAFVEELPARGLRWEDFAVDPIDERSLDRHPAADASFAPLGNSFSDAKSIKALESDFVDWIYRSGQVQVWHNPHLKLYGSPELSEEEFLKLCSQEAGKKREAEIEKTRKKYERSLNSLQKKLSREQRELQEDEAEANQRKMEEIGTHLENVMGLFGGSRRRLTTSLTKRRMTSQAQSDVVESKAAIQELESEIQEMGEEVQEAVEDLHDRWDEMAAEIEQIPVAPLKKDIYVSVFGIAWLPHHRVDEGGREMELPAYELPG
jgi:hypothetical protein